MGVLDVVLAWDAALRAGDWVTARATLADDATYWGPPGRDEGTPTCSSADEIVALMRSWKGKVPDVEVVRFDDRGDHVLAHLRQPAFGPDADWFQVLTVRDDAIVDLRDHGSEADAEASLSS